MKRRFSLLFLLAMISTSCSYQQHALNHAETDFAAHRYHRSLERLLPLADSGNPEAQYAIGYMFYYGRGAVEDRYLGKKYIRLAARQGFPLAIQALRLLNHHESHHA